MDINKKEVGERIKFIRISLGLTMEEFGEKVGKALKSNVSKWERGVSLPNNARLKQISEIGQVSMLYLLEGKLTSTDMEHAEKGKVFSMEQFFEGFSNEITENAMNYSLDFLNNYKSYDKLEISTINNLFMLLETLRTIDNSKLSKNTKEFIATLLQNLNFKIKNNSDIELDNFFSSVIEQLTCSDN